MAWEWSERKLGVLEYFARMGYEVDDEDWWKDWWECYESGVIFHGWADMGVGTSVYSKRIGMSLDYQRYSGWWRVESRKPRAVSDGGDIGHVR